MPRGSSSVSRNSGTRETPAASKVFSSSQIGSFSSTAMMSARGTITSSTRRRAEAQDAQQHLALLGGEGAAVAGALERVLERRPQGRGAGQAEPGAQGGEPTVRLLGGRLLGGRRGSHPDCRSSV